MNTTKEQLWNFMKQNGTSLDACGASELGFNLDDASELVLMIHASGMDILGMEVWRSDEDGYSIGDSTEIWYPEGTDRGENFQDAISFLSKLKLADNDVITIQL